MANNGICETEQLLLWIALSLLTSVEGQSNVPLLHIAVDSDDCLACWSDYDVP